MRADRWGDQKAGHLDAWKVALLAFLRAASWGAWKAGHSVCR